MRIFFEEVTSYLTTHPRSSIDDVRFVAYDKDKATVVAFRGMLFLLKSMVCKSILAHLSWPVSWVN